MDSQKNQKKKKKQKTEKLHKRNPEMPAKGWSPLCCFFFLVYSSSLIITSHVVLYFFLLIWLLGSICLELLIARDELFSLVLWAAASGSFEFVFLFHVSVCISDLLCRRLKSA